MNKTLEKKYLALKDYLKSLQSVAVAFSGGVDSTLLLCVAHEVLGKKCCAITVNAQMVLAQEITEAKKFCQQHDVTHYLLNIDALHIEGFAQNTNNRCYACKKALFKAITAEAYAHGFAHVADGTNTSDLNDFRPGLKAIDELGVKSPLKQAGLSKADVRVLSRELRLATHSKPSNTCLATRVPYGEQITAGKLKSIEAAENALIAAGFTQVRCRAHECVSGELLARIEVAPSERVQLMKHLAQNGLASSIYDAGFSYVAACASGYGSANTMKGAMQ